MTKLSKEDMWFTSLSVNEKECVASKILDSQVPYPEATGVWLNCTPELKAQVFDFCKNKDVADIANWGNEGSFSY